MRKRNLIYTVVVYIIYTIILVAPVAYSQNTGDIRGVDVGQKFGVIAGVIAGFYFLFRKLFKGKK